MQDNDFIVKLGRGRPKKAGGQVVSDPTKTLGGQVTSEPLKTRGGRGRPKKYPGQTSPKNQRDYETMHEVSTDPKSGQTSPKNQRDYETMSFEETMSFNEDFENNDDKNNSEYMNDKDMNFDEMFEKMSKDPNLQDEISKKRKLSNKR